MASKATKKTTAYKASDNHAIRRSVAHLLDGIMIGTFVGYAAAFFGLPMAELIAIASYVGYETLMTATMSSTVGKVITGLKVVRITGNAAPELSRAFARALIKVIPLVPFVILFQLMIGKTPIHDRIVKTRVKRALS
jgi:uncharacterized RDD family membrane protein YckC